MFELLGCNIDIEPQRMSAIVRTESAANPYAVAVAVVGYRLSSQPSTLEQATLVADQLKEEGLNYSIGLGQVNQVNFPSYGITHQNGFDTCTNLQAASAILKKCYNRFGDWDKAYSCYYSGNPETGFRHGYVSKVHANYVKPVITSVSLPQYIPAISITKLTAKQKQAVLTVKKDISPTYTINEYHY